MKILVVDDDKKDLNRINNAISNVFQSAEVFFAEDETQAFDIIEKEYPDIVILDIVLQKEHGYSVCHKIVKIHSDIIVILVTSNFNFIDSQLASYSGAYDFTIKTREMKELKKILRNVKEEMLTAV